MQTYDVQANYEHNGSTYEYRHQVAAESAEAAAEWMVSHLQTTMGVTPVNAIKVYSPNGTTPTTYTPHNT